MSYYEDERRRHRPARDRPRHDSYDDDMGYTSRDHSRGGGALVKRRDSYDSVEEVSRDFSPGRGGYIRETTIRKSGTRPARPRSYDDDRYDYDDRSRGGGRHHGRHDDDRYDRRSRRYSSEYSSRSRSRTPPRRKDTDRRKSKTEEALASLGLGGLAATLLGKQEHSRERDRSRDRSRDRGKSRGRDRAHSEDRHGSRNRSKSRGPSRDQITQALKAAVLAGAGEAVRARKEPGGWTGGKGKRVMTAAISAGGLDTLLSHGKGEEEHKTRNTIGSAIAGIATSRLVNGPREKSAGRNPNSRPGSPDSHRGRSQSRGLGDVAAGGVVVAAAKKAYDSVRSRSGSRGRPRSRSASSYDSRSPPRNSRRRSVSRGVAKGLAAVGLTGYADKVDPDRRRADRRADEYDPRPGGYGYDDRDYYRDDVGPPQPGFPNRAVSTSGAPRDLSRSQSDWEAAHRGDNHHHHPSHALDYGPHHYGDPDTDSDSDLGSSSGEEKERKKGKRKTLITTGLAAVATIHAGNSVYQSYNKRTARQKAVKEGKISQEQAKANRNRDRLQDAASVGLAALGIKGAYSEFKEMREARKEFNEKKETIERHKSKRAARREKFANGGYSPSPGEFSHSMPDLHAPQPMHAVAFRPGDGPRYESGHLGVPGQPFYNGQGPYETSTTSFGPHYYDDNPYSTRAPSAAPASMPGPPMPAPVPTMHNPNMHAPGSFPGTPRGGDEGYMRSSAPGAMPTPTPASGQHRAPGPQQPFMPGASPTPMATPSMNVNGPNFAPPPPNGGSNFNGPPPPVQPHG